ncbi:MAG: hypothetical protein BRD35_02605 [Bacteroidetes bacterium QH_7_62_13]|nr:MAG: hypothetical protein BRD35_02605 [Bacteroidetes bacterium QH_7_62_13]
MPPRVYVGRAFVVVDEHGIAVDNFGSHCVGLLCILVLLQKVEGIVSLSRTVTLRRFISRSETSQASLSTSDNRAVWSRR